MSADRDVVPNGSFDDSLFVPRILPGRRRIDIPSDDRALPAEGTLERAILEDLRSEGYEIHQVLGKGKTGRTYLVSHDIGEGVNQTSVIKIPLDDDPYNDSVQHVVNTSKGDRDMNAAEWMTKLNHKNIVKIQGVKKIRGKTVIQMNDYGAARDLEAEVRNSGRVEGEYGYERFVKFGDQLVSAVSYLKTNHVLHRDIKPSNILVDNQGDIILADFQNAARDQDVMESSMPTRGGTALTHPELLLALAKGGKARASMRTEVYSVGATFYHILTGEDLFDYKITYTGDLPKAVSGIDREKIGFEFNSKDHEKKLRSARKKVPRHLWPLIRDSLSLESKTEIRDIDEFKMRWEKVKHNRLGRFGEAVIGSIKPVAISIAGAATLGGFIYLAATTQREEPPTLPEILRKEDFITFSYQDLKGFDKEVVLENLRPTFESLKEDLESAVNKDEREGRTEELKTASLFNRLDLRTMSAWLRALYLADNKALNDSYEAGKRTGFTFTPMRFVQMSRSSIYHGAVINHDDAFSRGAQISAGMNYLKLCLRQPTFADVMAEYFLDSGEMRGAMARTGSATYFTKEVTRREKMFGKETDSGYYACGFRHMVDPRKRDVIDKATALYMITDDEGRIDSVKFDSVKRELDRVDRMKVYNVDRLPEK